MSKVLATPGVYIEEKSALPNSAVPVATAVPAFIGYTEKAVLNQKDITHVPTKISAFAEYELYFGGGPTTKFTLSGPDPKDPNIPYTLSRAGDRFYLYHCIKLFFANGGSDCYIISIGNYEKGLNIADFGADGVETDAPLKGLGTLLKEPEPTIVVIRDLMSLSAAELTIPGYSLLSPTPAPLISASRYHGGYHAGYHKSRGFETSGIHCDYFSATNERVFILIAQKQHFR